MKKVLLSAAALSMALVSCNKDESAVGPIGGDTPIEEIQTANSFNWETTKDLDANITIKDLNGAPLKGVRVDIYTDEPENGGELITSGFTNASGRMDQLMKVATYQKEVLVLANTFAVGNRMVVSTEGSKLNANFGGVPAPRLFDKTTERGTGGAGLVSGYSNVYYLDNFNSRGVPAGMTTGPVPTSLMNNLAAALPESQSVPCNPLRAPLVAEGVSTEVVTKSQTDVFVTWIGEGAGFKNALAFHYYPKNAPPANKNAIDSIFVIYPNASTASDILQAGDRVKLGNFPANTVISWVLLQNEWDPATSQVVNKTGLGQFFAIDDFNEDMGNACLGPNFDRHMVAFKEDINGDTVEIFGFEDLTFPGGDNDFNDALWYTSGDVEVCKKAPNLVSGVDSDQDGVDDSYDDFPNDPTRACRLCYQGTVAFEDLWPARGDYDFNDAVIDYKGFHVINAQGDLIDSDIDYALRAYGAGQNNGYGFVLDDNAPSSVVTSVTGTVRFPGGYTVVDDANGTEANPPAGPNEASGAVVIAVDELKKFFTTDIQGGPFFNTDPSGGLGTVDTFNIVMNFVPNTSMADVGLPPYNPFLFINQDRGREVHLCNEKPTPMVNASFFGTKQDDSDPGAGRFYKGPAPANLPFGINIHFKFDYPKEKVVITDAYNFFEDWAASDGALFPDWYLDKPGYRNSANIF